jgi:YebC/PmpR family DNA-binding regulatory protein
MSGHSKWANIKRRKAAVDAEKGRMFSRLVREITSAARTGGGNPDANPRLRAAIEKARDENLPLDTIQRAILRGTRAASGEGFEQLQYEGYGPGGTAILLTLSTDNRNRTAAEIRHLFTRYGGSLGEAGCVAWMFERRGRVRLGDEPPPGDERLLEAALEAGADDAGTDEEGAYVLCDPDRLEEVASSLRQQGLEVEEAETIRVPTTKVQLTGPEAERCLDLLEALEAHDDVEAVYTNAEFPEVQGQAGA